MAGLTYRKRRRELLLERSRKGVLARERIRMALPAPEYPPELGPCAGRIRVELWGMPGHEFMLMRGAKRTDQFRVRVDGRAWRDVGADQLGRLIALAIKKRLREMLQK